MTQINAHEKMQIIKNITTQTRQTLDYTWMKMSLWGGLILIAFLVNQILNLFFSEYNSLYSYLWGSFAFCGILGMFLIRKIQIKNSSSKIKTTVGKTINYIWLFIFINISFIVFSSLVLDVFKPDHILKISSLCVGIGLFNTGIILKSKFPLFLSFGSIPLFITMYFFPEWQSLVYGIFHGGGFFVNGLIIRFYKKELKDE